jgi:hypothetical protein
MTAPAWRFLVNADGQELDALRERLAIPDDLLDHALDLGERPRIRTTPSVAFILLRVPVALPADADAPFGTRPLAIFVTEREVRSGTQWKKGLFIGAAADALVAVTVLAIANGANVSIVTGQ